MSTTTVTMRAMSATPRATNWNEKKYTKHLNCSTIRSRTKLLKFLFVRMRMRTAMVMTFPATPKAPTAQAATPSTWKRQQRRIRENIANSISGNRGSFNKKSFPAEEAWTKHKSQNGGYGRLHGECLPFSIARSTFSAQFGGTHYVETPYATKLSQISSSFIIFPLWRRWKKYNATFFAK